VFGLLAGYLRQVEKMHRQQRELSASQLQLVETQQAYFALHIKHSTTEALMQQFQTQATHLAEAHAKLRQAEASLHTTNEQATAREQELQRLVVFLKDEIKASEAQVNELKELLKQRTEIKPAE
jgi:chromosome segregation ATPase